MNKVAAGILICLMLTGCGSQSTDNVYKSEFFAMDTVMLLTIYGDNAADAEKACENEIYRIDNLLSTGLDTSEISLINKNSGGTLSTETAGLLRASFSLYDLTGGAFDITVYPIVSAWGFYSGEYTVLTENNIARLLPLVGSDKLLFDGDSLSFAIPGMSVDLGGIGKGYTSDQIRSILIDNDITSALASLGGNVVAFGSKPDGSNWKVAVQDPQNPEGYIGILEVSDKMVVTSGGYQRYFETGGKTYHHIIDPSTGFPSESGLISVTIVSDEGLTADGLSTALFIMGKDDAAEFWRAHRELFDAVLVTTDNEIYVTDGLSNSFTSDLNFEVIK